jgi:membrane-bound serine protease (ClpP class)
MHVVRRLSISGILLVAAGALLLGAPTASAQGGDASTSTAEAGIVDVVKVDGLLDPVTVDFVERSVIDAERAGATALVLQIDSTGSVVSTDRLSALIDVIAASSVPVDLWIGPSGSQLTGEPAQLVGVASELAMAPGTRVGNAGTLDNPNIDQQRLDLIRDRTLNDTEAGEFGLTTVPGPTIGDFIVNLPGVETREITTDDGQIRREPVTLVRFGQLSLLDQLMHTVASPAVAYLLLAFGLGLMLFELFTAGVGVAGVVGAGAFVLACYGLAVLPATWWGIALICFSMFAFGIDVQTGVPRFWTAVGVVTFVLGSFTLYDGLSLSWVTLLAGIVGVVLAFVAGMPSMVRTRFSTPTIGREWMLGEMGRAVTAIAPDGVVQIREALWRAYTNRATPIDELDRVRVVGIEGLVLEVEPEEGAARDYRERRPKDSGPSTDA